MRETKNKNPYLFCRKKRDVTRDVVNEFTGISTDRLGDIENNLRKAEPEDVSSLSEFYKIPRLCNFYCSQECEVGKKMGLTTVDIDAEEDLAQITLEVLYCLDDLKKINKKRLIAISRDGKITEEEQEDFERLKSSLKSISDAYASLKLWEQENQISNSSKQKK